ncbi:MAG: sialidase family protein [Eubacteriales bacterium]|nr:sialidase family protein [Eubacteriales bacterium]
MKLVWDLAPTPGNARNSEGSFLRLDDGRILFAYSRFSGDNWHDEMPSDIVAVCSCDEGESWSEPRVVASAQEFGVRNIMSVSVIRLNDGAVAVYFLIKENDGSSTIGRALTRDGESFCAQRCECNFASAYYVFNNDRFERLRDGRIAVPAARGVHDLRVGYDPLSVSLLLVSEDDGRSFRALPARLTLPCLRPGDVGMQEPGIREMSDGTIWLWARTSAGCQYECFSRDGLNSFTPPQPSIFTSPTSPLEIAEDPASGALYAAYNPVPVYNGRKNSPAGWGRTPLVLRKSCDEGRTWGPLNVVEDDEDRGFCYPAMFFTADGALLCAYCRGGSEDKACLARLGMMKIPLEEIQ